MACQSQREHLWDKKEVNIAVNNEKKHVNFSLKFLDIWWTSEKFERWDGATGIKVFVKNIWISGWGSMGAYEKIKVMQL